MSNNAIRCVDRPRPSMGVWLIWIYAFWLITTPVYSPRLQFLGAIRFEKILAGILTIYSLTNLGALWRDKTPIILFTSFFGVALISAVLTPVENINDTQLWLDNYWKLWLLFICVLLSLRTSYDVYLIMIGIAAIALGYQLLSWRDFLAGGSYVYQQGMKRMTGAWSGGGLGAANGFASMALNTLPYHFCWTIHKRTRGRQALMMSGVAISVISMVFSGTRGAILVGAAVTVGATFVFSARRLRNLALACGAVGVLYLISPEHIRHRYTQQILPVSTSDTIPDQTEQVASRSAEGRVEGLVDGYLLFLKRPILGWGPGTSAFARMELDGAVARENPLQLHSLYGQILAETGLCGVVLFLWINLYLITSLIHILHNQTGLSRSLAGVLLTVFAIDLMYGFVSHTLFQYRWIILFALSTVLIRTQQYESGTSEKCLDELEQVSSGKTGGHIS